MQAQLQDLLAEMEGPQENSPSTTAGSSTSAAPGTEAETNFQSSINETIRRLQQSNRQATEATSSSSADPAEDFMAAMLKQLGEGGAGGGAANDEDFSKLLLGMMEELTVKEILYEPMKELDDRFPRWIEENRGKIDAEEMKRYEEQRVIVRDVVARYDRKEYSDSNPADREFIVSKMHEVRESFVNVNVGEERRNTNVPRCNRRVRRHRIW